MFSFLGLTLQMGHTVQNILENCWTKMEQLGTQFYGQTMARARYCHILSFLHFTENNRNGVDRTNDRLWKIRDLFEIIRTNFSKFYKHSDHLAVDEIHFEIQGKGIIQTVYPEKNQTFRHQNVHTMWRYDIHMTWIFTSVKTDKGRHNTWQQPTLQWLIWQGV